MMELSSTIRSVFKDSSLDFYLNGTRIALKNANPQWTLLDFIRSQHGLKGTKLGCGEGGCGACTVVLQVLDNSAERKGRVKHLAVNACLFPLVGGKFCPIYDLTMSSWKIVIHYEKCQRSLGTVVGKHVITVEGIGSLDNPHPLQERMAKLHGSQ